jgi:hypothetical protein
MWDRDSGAHLFSTDAPPADCVLNPRIFTDPDPRGAVPTGNARRPPLLALFWFALKLKGGIMVIFFLPNRVLRREGSSPLPCKSRGGTRRGVRSCTCCVLRVRLAMCEVGKVPLTGEKSQIKEREQKESSRDILVRRRNKMPPITLSSRNLSSSMQVLQRALTRITPVAAASLSSSAPRTSSLRRLVAPRVRSSSSSFSSSPSRRSNTRSNNSTKVAASTTMGSMEVYQFPALQDNYCFLLHDPATGDTAVVDTPEVWAVQLERS